MGRALEKQIRKVPNATEANQHGDPKHLCFFGRVPPCRIKVYWGLQYCDLLFMEATKTFCFRAQTGVEQKELEHTVQAPTPKPQNPKPRSLQTLNLKLQNPKALGFVLQPFSRWHPATFSLRWCRDCATRSDLKRVIKM